ncbi:bifunctional [glutamate--ammonia ligase]-adenylyl-L-tyrosine phosphorylase/[glutamate--ammonia-ligase] adenylyltransferase [Paucibacter sp. KBW04]|uniref:bifunctional [glutamate--ammonia ligase]-adenylyl-L-tyrosine phosphorylase/[glutamate--ammonia-ligase] adenylyltransferase n=1 Tax=Paucibacter sp. KBW04 TaxID=2153361 RepID=UPI000F57FF1F|nr:bifunctional [glutamate--ammonia ligase]-adenylyl-L-tyrosine phosphorylase/[glutamate--ammonia-ligase] adenylyltransferase [Paucibacter sp. KBW04]RQO54723.1 bifunctional [glutamate--ammonia ligase]-adenylyl-L-tyrosine phosphorylase/[glutamate--ammonia-ligase] adenylyltransferase [Paucibacter sp. KBW04]
MTAPSANASQTPTPGTSASQACEAAVFSPLPARADHSRFVQRVRRRYAAELGLLPPGQPTREAIEALIAHLQTQGKPLAAALRVARHLVLERLAVLDVEAQAPMEAITEVMTVLAEVTLCLALDAARAEQDALNGAPRNEQGEVIEFWVLGMGKLGARELNVSSDIDLIYVYEDEGQTDGSSPISAHEYFARVAKRLYALIGEVTDDGQVFRVDLALRPNGNSGPAAVSMAMLEEYFLVQGREWERFAWLKSRVVAPRASVQNGRALVLRSLVTPFVYRRYLDYGVFEGLRQLHRKIREEAQRRAAGRPERANDVKLSRGGIREIEFTVQLLQVVRGGQFPEIRTRSTLKALERLAAGGLMKAETAAKLAQAYVFLRRVEHRIQFLDDQQTHCLPAGDEDLAWIARSLGLTCKPDGTPGSCALLDQLCEVREIVATEFDALLHDGHAPVGTNGCRGCGGPALAVDSDEFLAKLQPELATAVRRWASQDRVQNLREESRLRLAKLVGRAALAVRDGGCTLDAALRFVDWMEPLLRRESYLALMVERPSVQSRLLRLLGLARWPMRYLMLHPGVIDELADNRLLNERFDGKAFVQDMQERFLAWDRSGEAQEEALLDTLRRAHHAEVFRTLVRDVEQKITVEQVADELSALADAILQCTIHWAWARLKQAHRESPRFAVIAYGKLGGKELGYGGDLDVVFLFDDEDERAHEVYGAFVRKLITWLTVRTSAGELFDIDTALRPNGNSGLLVTSLASFEKYQTGRGSNTAWTWEHQAITRARWCAGDPELAAGFEAVRSAVLTAPRDHAALRSEVQAMRDKVRQAHPVRAGKFDIKHSPGGMMDAEFALQYLVLAHAGAHPELIGNLGVIALLQRAEAAGLLPEGVGHQAADAYRELRRAQHRARLDEQPTAVDLEAIASLGLEPQRAAVLALWRAVFS